MASSSGKANKKGNVIHRTTSESLRLGDDLYKIPQNSGNRKKAISSPSCSFQITGVLTRCDLEDESADDLDESHTDDISRVTDNETPSFSEDSRDTDDHHITQTVISSISSQQSISVSKINDANDIHVSPIELDKSSNNTNNTNNTVGRFTVVKSENVVPFSRGRWTCFDYVDEIAKISVGLDKIFGHEPNNTKTGTSINYLEVGSIIDEKTRPYWESNCQQPYLYTGSILMPQPIPIYVPVSSRTSNQKNKKTNSIALSQNILIKPSSHVVDNFASNALSFHMLVNGNKKNQHTFDIMDNLQNRAMETETLTSGALELATESITCENNNSEASSVACTASIDTKIEHALDVVKNHLTHAVRLEVEELKVKINELVERISNLEYENDLLRANVPPEVLATLNNTSAE